MTPLLTENEVKLEQAIISIGTQILRINGDDCIVYYNPAENALAIQKLVPEPRVAKFIPLRFGTTPIVQAPNSIFVQGSELYLWYNEAASLLVGDTSGQLRRKVVFSVNENEQLFAGNDRKFLTVDTKVVMPLTVAASDEHPNSVYTYCDRVFSVLGDTATAVSNAGRYPANYSIEPVKLSIAYRFSAGNDRIIYAFQGSDSICTANLKNGKNEMRLMESAHGNHFAPFPKERLSDMQFILNYYKTAEQNMFAKFDSATSRLFVVKALGRKSLTEPRKFELLVLDADLKTIADVSLDKEQLFKDIFVVQGNYIYTGSAYGKTLYKYELQ